MSIKKDNEAIVGAYYRDQTVTLPKVRWQRIGAVLKQLRTAYSQDDLLYMAEVLRLDPWIIANNVPLESALAGHPLEKAKAELAGKKRRDAMREAALLQRERVLMIRRLYLTNKLTGDMESRIYAARSRHELEDIENESS